MIRIVTILLFVGDPFGLKTHAEQSGDPKDVSIKYAEKYTKKIRAELLLDDATGFLTYQLRCISDESVKIHLESLQEAEVTFDIEPDVDVIVDFDDEIRAFAYTPEPYSEWVKMAKECNLTLEERIKNREREDAMDRVVELKKNESISRSFYLYDTPWFDELVKKLEVKKFKAYRIDPHPFIYTVDTKGNPVIDHYIEILNFENVAKGSFKKIYYTGGLIFDLARAKKIQAMRPPPAKPSAAFNAPQERIDKGQSNGVRNGEIQR